MMKALVSHIGQAVITDELPPQIKNNFVLVKTAYSAISPGTELTSLRMMRDQPHPLGYSASGIALEVGENVADIQPGQPVACYGTPYVKHAEFLLVPKHLVVPVPSEVGLDEASTVGLGGIAIHALRQAALQFGETVIIVGLGILGQIMARIAHAACLKVIALDLLPERREALSSVRGITVCSRVEDIAGMVDKMTGSLGADAVLHCAGGHQKELLDQSFDWLVDRGKIVIVGDLYMEYTRARMFAKEAQVIISRAAGPGRYDRQYEYEGCDYPPGYVRWTEGRNLREYIHLLAERRIDIRALFTKRVPMTEAGKLYEAYGSNPQSLIGALLVYN